jgi:hypothetical protein
VKQKRRQAIEAELCSDTNGDSEEINGREGNPECTSHWLGHRALHHDDNAQRETRPEAQHATHSQPPGSAIRLRRRSDLVCHAEGCGEEVNTDLLEDNSADERRESSSDEAAAISDAQRLKPETSRMSEVRATQS